MNTLELVNGNKGLEKLLTTGGFIKTTESTSVGSSSWLYDTFYNHSLKCRIEYNSSSDFKGYNVFLNVSQDIEDTIDCDVRMFFTNLKSLKQFYSKIN